MTLSEVDGPADTPDTTTAEVRRLLAVDTTRLGDVYRGMEAELTAAEIAAQAGVSTAGFVSNYRAIVNAMVDGTVPTSPGSAVQVASRIRAWIKRRDISAALRVRLVELLAQLEERSEDTSARTIEQVAAQQLTEEVENKRTPGIYVYTLPHYLLHPYDPKTGRTLLKVGRSERDTYERAHSQGRITALPEDPILLRVYPVPEGATAEAEKAFHSWLVDADHERSRSLRGGSEWFLTSTKFLDRIAASRGLNIIVVADSEVIGDD